MRRWLPVPRCLWIPASGGEVWFALAMENGGFGSDSGPSRSDSYRPALRPEDDVPGVKNVRSLTTRTGNSSLFIVRPGSDAEVEVPHARRN